MAHPFHDQRQSKVEHSRVAKITKGYKFGGGIVNPDVGSDDRMPIAKVATAKSAGKIGGAKAKPRLDRPAFARGGRAKGGKTDVTVIVQAPTAPDAGAPPMPPPMPPPMAAAPPPMPPPRPPMVPPPGAAPPGGPPPGGMPIRNRGGRVQAFKSGGAVKADGIKNGTKVSHTPGKNDLDMLSKKPALLTRKDGGAVKKHSFDDGAGSGPGRLEKIGKSP